MAYDLIGKDFVPPDVLAKVTGRARYAEDFRAEGMVFAKLLTSPMPHARINGIDASAALAMEGVFGILTAEDEGAGTLLTNEPLFVGHPILAVAAVDERTAQDAIDAIRLDAEPLEFVVDPLESLYPGGPNAGRDGTNASSGRGMGGMGGGGPGRTLKWAARDFAVPDGQLPMGEPAQEWSFGDLEAGFAEASLVLDETFVTQGNSHHSMEPRTTMSYWENGKCYVHTGCQSHTAALGGISRQCGVGVEDVVLVNEYCGGGFGSKSGGSITVGITALLSKKIARPVMLRISRHEEYFFGSARGGFQGRIRLGFRDDGRITAADLYLVQDAGSGGGFPDANSAGGAVSIIYQPQAMRYRGISITTNSTPRGAQRGPGQNQIAAAVEPIVDKAARELGLDRLAIRRINAPDSSGTVGSQQGPLTSAYMAEALDQGAEQFDWATRSQRSGDRQGPKAYGVGIGQAYHSAGRSGYDGLVVLTPEGKLHLHTGVGNLGTYSYVATTRPAAEVLRCDWENCVIEHGISTRHLPSASAQNGSNTSYTMTRTNYVAALDALQKLKEIAAMDLGGEPDDYDVGDHRVFATADPERFITYRQAAERAIEIGGRYSGAEAPEDIADVTRAAVAGVAGTGLVGIARDNLPSDGNVPALSVGFAEVEVDLETGKVEILDYVGVADCGTVLHPQGLAQQVKGGGVWGMSFALHERQIYDTQNGLPGNVGLLTCKPSGYLDVPSVMQWSATDIADPQNPVGVRGIGEPPMGAASAAVLSAISDALDGHLFNRVPVVPDMIVNHVAGQPQSHGPLDVQTA